MIGGGFKCRFTNTNQELTKEKSNEKIERERQKGKDRKVKIEKERQKGKDRKGKIEKERINREGQNEKTTQEMFIDVDF